MSDEDYGWGFPTNSQKAHYFHGFRSICLKWGYNGRLQKEAYQDALTCKECKKRLEKHMKSAKKE